MKKKGLALLLALTLVVVGVASGTLAWLTAKSDTVVNTFTTSNIEVKLEETKGQDAEGGKEFKMIPGYTIDKDPKAWVVEGSEDCYLFVKVTVENNTYGSGDSAVNYLTYQMADGWILVPGRTDVYYRTVTSTEMGEAHQFSVLKHDQVTVSGDVTSAMMTAAANVQPKLTVTAYASQLHMNADADFEAADAWANIK